MVEETMNPVQDKNLSSFVSGNAEVCFDSFSPLHRPILLGIFRELVQVPVKNLMNLLLVTKQI